MSESSWYLGKFIRRFLGQQALPPYPEDAFRLRTPYGMCLMFAFATGEGQDKIYRLAMSGDWALAQSEAERLKNIEEILEKHCGVDVRRPRFCLERIMDAIRRKDKDAVEDLIFEHDLEIVAALQISKPPSEVRY
jgi:hypothetical protein